MQQTIDKHISALLYHHECVVVPSFGAFITRYYSAEINPSTHMFRPGGKRVSFNQRVNQNDGVLAQYISKQEGISYNEAIESITISIRAWKKMLRSGKKINLAKVGLLYMDDEARLQFSPSLEVNYDVHSFGLAIFRAPSVQREAAIEQSINKVIESHKKSKNQPILKRPFFRWAAVLAPLIGLGIYAFTALAPAKVGFNGFSSLLPAYSASKPAEQEVVAVEPHVLPEFVFMSEPFVENEVAEHTVERKAEPTPIERKEVVHQKPATPAVNNQQGLKYHIVVGSFKEEENALKYVRLLQRNYGVEGYIAAGKTNFYRVAVAGFSTRAKADKQLSDIKQQVNSAAWVYRN